MSFIALVCPARPNHQQHTDGFSRRTAAQTSKRPLAARGGPCRPADGFNLADAFGPTRFDLAVANQVQQALPSNADYPAVPARAACSIRSQWTSRPLMSSTALVLGIWRNEETASRTADAERTRSSGCSRVSRGRADSRTSTPAPRRHTGPAAGGNSRLQRARRRPRGGPSVIHSVSRKSPDPTSLHALNKRSAKPLQNAASAIIIPTIRQPWLDSPNVCPIVPLAELADVESRVIRQSIAGSFARRSGLNYKRPNHVSPRGMGKARRQKDPRQRICWH